jgi:uncharacterized protein with FMN-binding domain
VADTGSKKKVANSLVALSSAAVIAVYGAGYARTRAAADRFAPQGAERHARAPLPRGAALSLDDAPTAPPEPPPLAQASARPTAAGTVDTPPAAEPVTTIATPGRAAAPAQASAPDSNIAAAPRTETAVPSAAPTAAASGAASPAPAPDPAPAPTEPAPPLPAPVVAAVNPDAPYKDGTYYGWGSCRHGDIQAAVVIEAGRMASATVAQCLTRYACSWIDPLLPHTVRQQAATADYVSGATESSEAFNDAVSEALSQAH